MNKMVFKSFTWRYNPSNCTYSCERTIIKHKYPELIASELEDMNTDGAVISGSGEFFGSSAYSDWNALNRIFKDGGAGYFYHPIFADVTQAMFKKLEASVEPRENYVSYTFEFWENMPAVAKISPQLTILGIADNELRLGNTGASVLELQQKLIQNNILLPIYGANGVYNQETECAVRKYQYNNKLTISGIADKPTLSKLGITIESSTIASKTSNDNIYTVKSGDTLSKICARVSLDWRQVAILNHLKSPHLIRVGDKIKLS